MKTTDSGIFEKRISDFVVFSHNHVSRRTCRWQIWQIYMEETGDRFVKLISIDTITAYW